MTRFRLSGVCLALTALSCGGGQTAAGMPASSGSSGETGGTSAAGAQAVAAGGASGSAVVSHACNDIAECKATGSLGDGAPALTVGMWVNISPPGVPFGDNNGSPTFTQGIAIDPCDPSILYLTVDGFDVGGSKAGLYKSTNAGGTWRKIGQVKPNFTGVDHLDEPIRVRIDPKNSNHLYVVDGVRGGTSGFWVSCDAGETFYQPETFASLQNDQKLYSFDTYDVAVDPADFNHLLVTSHSTWGDKWSNSSGVLESKDGGDSWIVHAPQDKWGTGHAIAFLSEPGQGIGNGDTWLLSNQLGGRFRTEDAGKTWTQVTDSQGIEHGGGTTYYSKSGVLYASGTPKNVRSTDNGRTFTPIESGGSGFTAILGDGTTLFTAPTFGPTSFFTSPESDGQAWTALNSQQFTQGPFELAYDSINHILYSGTWKAGMLALKIK